MFRLGYFSEIAVWLLLAVGPSWADDVPPVDPIPPPGPVAPDLPVAAIDVADVSGRPITSSAELSKLLVCTSDKAIRGSEVGSLTWIVDAEPPALIEYTITDGGNTLVVNTGSVATNLKLMQIAAKGDRAAYQRILIKIGQGDIPPPVPPGPGPGPGPEPIPPTPAPTAERVNLSVLADPLRSPPAQAMLLNQRELWKTIPGAVWPRRDWSIEDPSPRAVQMLKDANAAGMIVGVDKKGRWQPLLFIDDAATGKNLTIADLPETIEELRKLVARYVKAGAK